MKKEIEVNKDLFKRISSTKNNRKFTISEPVKITNKHQAAADFVASQKRTSNTKGKNSELANNWTRFSYKPETGSTKPSIKPKSTLKPKLNPAQKAQIKAHKLAQKRALTNSASPMNKQISSSDEPGSAHMGHNVEAKAGAVTLTSPTAAKTIAGYANLAENAANRAAPSSAVMGHHALGQAGFASLEASASSSPTAGKAVMGKQLSKEASYVSLEGRDQTLTSSGLAEAEEAAPSKASDGVDSVVETEISEPSSRLAEKMSKIRAQSADITMDTEALQERNDTP